MYPFLGKPKGYKQKINPLAYKLTNHPNVYIYKEEIRNDHSKYYIFDNQVLIIGGINIEDKEIYTDVSGVKYCDYMVEMNGDEYIKEFNSQLNEGRFYKNEPTIEFIYNIKRNNTKVFKAKTEILKLINSATSSIDLVMAYFGDRDINNAIIEKANQGVKVTIITAQKANIQNDLNRKVLKELMKKTNNKINLYLSRRMVHAKLIQVDGKVMTVGSINLNRAALIKMYETNVLVKNYQPEFNEKLQESIRKSISESVKISDHNQITYKRVKAFLESLV
jgi:cardiolipin synthase